MFERNLIIGLGGQGGRSIAAFRREMVKNPEDAARISQAPFRRSGAPCQEVRVSYLYIDSSKDQLRERQQWEQYGESVSLLPEDVIFMDPIRSLEILKHHPAICDGAGDLLEQIRKRFASGGMPFSHTGASQLRRFGRAMFAAHAQTIQAALHARLRDLMNGGSRSDGLCVHIFCSLGGGTGSGCLIDMLTMIHTMAQCYTSEPVHIFVYGYVAGPDECLKNVGCFSENEYATLRDLNAFACGKYHPRMLWSEYAGEPPRRFEPQGYGELLNAVYLSSEYQTRVNLADQVENMARGCFTFISSEGLLPPVAQKAFSGEDLLAAFPGENGRLSYCFSGLATKTWSLPTPSLNVQLSHHYEALVAESWQKGNGRYARMPAKRGAEAAEKALSQNGFRDELDLLMREMADKLQRRAQDIVEKSPCKLADFERLTEMGLEYCDELQSEGLSSAEEARLHDCCQREVARLSREVAEHVSMRVQWRHEADEIWGLGAALEYVGGYITTIRETLQAAKEVGDDKDDLARLKESLKARKREFAKLGSFSRLILRQHVRLFREQAQDLRDCIALPMKAIAQDFLAGFYGELEAALDKVAQSLLTIMKGVEEMRRQAAGKANDVHAALTAQADSPCEKRESVPEHTRSVLDAMEAADLTPYLCSYNEAWCEYFDPVTRAESRAVESLRIQLRARFREHAKELQEREAARLGLPPLQEESILAYLSRIAGSNPAAWDRTLLPQIASFMNSLTPSVALERRGYYLTEPMSPWAGVLLIGLPGDARYDVLVNWLREQISRLVPASLAIRPGGIFMHRHESPWQIRLTYVPYWFPARFATVVPRLHKFYTESQRSSRAKAGLYFPNLEDSAEVAAMPDLLEDLSSNRCGAHGQTAYDVRLGTRIAVENAKGNMVPAVLVSDGIIRMLDPETREYGRLYLEQELQHPTRDFKVELEICLDAAIAENTPEERKMIHQQYREDLERMQLEGHSVNSPEYREAEAECDYVEKRLGLC